MKNNLSPKQLGQAVGVSESSLKRWIDDGRLAAVRTVGGHRRIPVSEAVRFIRESGMSVVEPQLLGIEGVSPSDAAVDQEAALLEALKEGDAAAVRGVLLGSYLRGASVAALFDGAIASAMTELGGLWAHEDKGIYIEHRATDLCIAAVSQLRAVLPVAAADAPVAVGGAPSDDPYLLGSLAVAATLQSIGWRAVNLGPQTPLTSLRDAALDAGARVIWISISTPEGGRRVAEDLSEWSAMLDAHDIQCIVGGRESDSLLSASSRIHRARTMAELTAFCSGLAAGGAAATSATDGSH